jgi:Domain of unknown function (DUF4265)
MNNIDYIKIIFEYFDEETQHSFVEAMWAKKTNNDNSYEIDTIPFYIKSVAVGDIFSVKESEGEFFPASLLQESGNSTVRLLFESTSKIQKYRKYLEKKFTIESELSNIPNLVSLNVPSIVDYKLVREYLESGENKKLWEYQEACISSIHRSHIRL